MSNFELEFRGRLNAYLRSLGHDVQQIDDYWFYTDHEYDNHLVVDFYDTSGYLDEVRFTNFILKKFLEEL